MKGVRSGKLTGERALIGDGNSFPLVVCVFQVILAYESIVLCMCSGKYIDIYFIMKITYLDN